MVMPPLARTLLENGDRLTRAEFEERYAASNLKKAELIKGRVYVASPLRFNVHSKPHGQMVIWLGVYQSRVPGLEVGIEPTVRLDEQNELQPDAVLFRVGGNAQTDAESYLTGAPELIVEIAASTASYDLHSQKQVYQRHGVKEYLVWRTLDRQIDWFVLADGAYRNLAPDGDGILRSPEFGGLWLNVSALLRGDMAAVLATLRT